MSQQPLTRRSLLAAAGMACLGMRPVRAMAAVPTAYDLVDIGSLNPDGSCYPTGIASNGLVSGNCGAPFVWSPADGMQPLSTGGGSTTVAYASGVNARRDVAGNSYRGVGSADAVLWPQAGSLTKIAAGKGIAVNDFGSVTGYYVPKTTAQALLARLVSGRIKIWSLGPGQGSAISPAGRVAGFTGSSETAAGFLWTPSTPNGTTGVRQSVTVGSAYTQPSGVNDAGQVVGVSCWVGLPPRAFLWQGGAGVSLGTLPGDPAYSDYEESQAAAINSVGTVVGQSRSINPSNTQSWVSRAFVWDAVGGMQDLNGLIPDSPAYELLSALGVNDTGHIVCRARVAGLDRGVVLTPRL